MIRGYLPRENLSRNKVYSFTMPFLLSLPIKMKGKSKHTFVVFGAMIRVCFVSRKEKEMYDSNTPQTKQRGCLIVVVIIGVTMFGEGSKPLPMATRDLTALRPQAKEVTFEDLARSTELYVNDLVYYTGEVIQVMEEHGSYAMRVNVTKDDRLDMWSDPILVMCNCPVRPLEQDIVEFVAKVDGRQSYQTVLGATVTLPKVTAQAFRVSP